MFNGRCTVRDVRSMSCIIDDPWNYARHLRIFIKQCEKCGRTFEFTKGMYHYCPHCGRRIANREV